MLQSALLAVGMTVVLLFIDPVLALRRARDRAAAASRSASSSGAACARARASAPHEGDRLGRQRGAVGDGRREGVRRRGLRVRARARRAASSAWASASRSRGCRRASTAPSASLRALATALVTVVGVLRVAQGAIGPGDLIIFVSYTRKAHSPMRSFAREATKLTAALARADRDRRDPRRRRGARGAPRRLPRPARATGEIELEDVSFAYGGERPGAATTSRCTIRPGERLALTGPSGAGKSTLAALVARFYDPTRAAC